MDRRHRRALIERLRGDGQRIAAHFGLRYSSLDGERANVKRRYGICYSDGSIRIRLAHAVNGHPLKYSSLVNTLCHELAHLRHFNHGPRFKTYYLRLLEWARAEGIYSPGPGGSGPSEPESRELPQGELALPVVEQTGPSFPRQLELFALGQGDSDAPTGQAL